MNSALRHHLDSIAYGPDFTRRISPTEWPCRNDKWLLRRMSARQFAFAPHRSHKHMAALSVHDWLKNTKITAHQTPPAVSFPEPLNPCADATSRRALLLSSASVQLAFTSLVAPCCCPPSAAWVLHSKRSDVACRLTVRNRSPRLVEARWVNYDGDEEPYTTIPPGHVWTVQTYQTHPWRFRDTATGALICEYVAQVGDRLLQLYDSNADTHKTGSSSFSSSSVPVGPPSGVDPPPSAQPRSPQSPSSTSTSVISNTSNTNVFSGGHDTQSGSPPPPLHTSGPPANSSPATPPQSSIPISPSSSPPAATFRPTDLTPGLAGGFDGLGNPASDYTAASLLSVTVLPAAAQAVLGLGLEGYERPLSLLVGLPEARNVVNAAGVGAARGRRPTLLATWVASLQALGGTLERVVITRQVEGVFYARLVLGRPWQGPAGGPPLITRQRSEASHGGGGGVVSVDCRPSDALAMALEAGADVFVSLPVAELVQQQYEAAQRELPERLLPPPEEDDWAGALLGTPSA